MTARPVIASLGFTTLVVTFGGTPIPMPSAQPAVSASASSPAAALSLPLAVPTPTYERKGRRDPFVPIVPEPEEEAPTIGARLTGIVRGNGTRALLEATNGIGYVLQLGDTLGRGRLVEIGADSVVFSVPSKGGSRAHRVVLRLPTD